MVKSSPDLPFSHVFFQGCPSCQTSGTGSKNEWSLRSTKVETQQVSCFLRGFPMFFFVESLFYDFGDWRCLCIPMKGPVEWSVWSVAVSEARSNGVIEQELYHHDERHLENSCNLSTKSQKKWSNIWDFYSKKKTLANIAMISELRNKLVPSIFFWPKKHIQNMGSFWDSNSSGIQPRISNFTMIQLL